MKTIRVATSTFSLALLLCVSAGCGTTSETSMSSDAVANNGGNVQELSSCTGDNGSTCTCPSGQACVATGGGCCCGCVATEVEATAQKDLKLPPADDGKAARVITRAPSTTPGQEEQLLASCTGDNGSTCSCPAGQACVATGGGCCCGCLGDQQQ